MKTTINCLVLLLIFLIISCSSGNKKKTERLVSPYTMETFQTEKGWGYEIKIKGKTRIKQTKIPGISGGIAFDSKADAERVGELVLIKLKQGSGFPYISKRELDSLQITYN